MKRISGLLFVLLIVLLWFNSGSFADQSLLDQGMATFKSQNYGRAVELLGNYLKDQPQAVEARRYRAQALARLERQEDALAEVEAVLSEQPSSRGRRFLHRHQTTS